MTADADNTSGKPLFNADVFGRVYDAQGNAAIDDSENIRISYIPKIEPGRTAIRFRIVIPLEQAELGPVEFKGLKVSGFSGGVLPNQGSGVVSDCDEFTAPEDCETIPF